MTLLRVDTRPLLPRLRAELAALLAGLDDGDWGRPTACPGWSVHGVAAHLLGVELGNVSVRRDHWRLGPGDGEDLDSWLNAFNQQWVEAARRISPALLIELIDVTGLRFESYLATLDLDAAGGPGAVGDRLGPGSGLARCGPGVHGAVCPSAADPLGYRPSVTRRWLYESRPDHGGARAAPCA